MISIEGYEETIIEFLKKGGVTDKEIEDNEDYIKISHCFMKGIDAWKVYKSLMKEHGKPIKQ